MTRAELKEMAKEQIKGNIGTLFLMYLIMIIACIVCVAVTDGIGAIASSLVAPAFALSIIMANLALMRNQKIAVGDVFKGFNYFFKAFLLSFLIGLFTFLWSLLLVIPGIMKSFSYIAAPTILANNPELSPLEAIRLSKERMYGHRFDYFVLQLSFILWCILGTITFGIAYIYVLPYMSQTCVNFFRSIGAIDDNNVEVSYSVEESQSNIVDNVAEIESKTTAELEADVNAIVNSNDDDDPIK